MKRADHHLVQQLLDGELAPADFEAFQARMRKDPGLEQLYNEYALLHHTLHEEFENASSPGGSAAISPSVAGIRISIWFAAAAVILLAAAFWWVLPKMAPTGEENIAVVSFSVDAVWNIDGTSNTLGSATGVGRGGTLRLHQGRAAIALEPSVNAVVEGPALVTFSSPNSLHLGHGRGYFHCSGTNSGLTVTTPGFSAVDSGTEFGIISSPDGNEELHVISGAVQVFSRTHDQSLSLATGEAVQIAGQRDITRIQSDGRPFPTHLRRFQPVVSGPFDKSHWRIEYGSPTITGQRIDGTNYSAFLRLPEADDRQTILLATIQTGKPEQGAFHTDGWAGLSFFSNGEEVAFFGDSFGTRQTWSLDVKQRTPVILPETPIAGPQKMTLRYDSRTGEVTLHHGTTPLSLPVCSGSIPPGIHMDEIRLGASAGAALAVNSLEIRLASE